MYKMPEIPDSFPELAEIRYGTDTVVGLSVLLFFTLTLSLDSLWSHSVSELKDMSDQDDMLLEFFMCLPQLKEVTSDKEELVNNIVEMASE